MRTDFDFIVAGLGAMGSAAVYHLAADGSRVLGLDRFHPPHELGSSHGRSRIIREAYFEHPLYVPLVQRAYELWRELEERSGRQLLRQTGGVMIGRADGALVSGAKRSAREHELQHEILSSSLLRERFPVLNPSGDTVGVWEPRAGVLFPELAVQTHLEQAARHGAHLLFDNPVMSWNADKEGVKVSTASGSYNAKGLLLSSGAWISGLLAGLRLPLAVERQVLFWFEPRADAEGFAPDRCPIFIWEYEPGRFFYGFPNLGDGVKIAIHHQGQTATPESINREVSENEIEGVRAVLKRYIPNANGA